MIIIQSDWNKHHPFVAAVVFEENRVARAAPIVRYMVGWTREQVLEYCKKRGFLTEVYG